MGNWKWEEDVDLKFVENSYGFVGPDVEMMRETLQKGKGHVLRGFHLL